MTCTHKNCNLKPVYGRLDIETRKFKRVHCQKHKKTGESRNPPLWINRYQDFKKIIKNDGFTLKTSREEWVKNLELCIKSFKPTVVCEKGHINKNSIYNFVKGRKCSYCRIKKPWTSKYNEYKELCERRNFTLLGDEKKWLRGTEKLGHEYKAEIMCNKGHIITPDMAKFKSNENYSCCKCSKTASWSGRFHEFENICFKNGYILLTKEDDWLVGTKKNGIFFRVDIMCTKGHIRNVSLDVFRRNKRCKSCNNKNLKYKYEDFVKFCIKNRYKLLTNEVEWLCNIEVLGRNYKPKVFCDKCKNLIETTSLQGFYRGVKCNFCRSNGEFINPRKRIKNKTKI